MPSQGERSKTPGLLGEPLEQKGKPSSRRPRFDDKLDRLGAPGSESHVAALLGLSPIGDRPYGRGRLQGEAHRLEGGIGLGA